METQGVVDSMRRAFDSARQLGPGDPGYLDDGFRKNSRQSPGRGKYGYVQAEDGSWVYNLALYQEEQRRNRSHRYPHGGSSGSGSRYGAWGANMDWASLLRKIHRPGRGGSDIGGA